MSGPRRFFVPLLCFLSLLTLLPLPSGCGKTRPSSITIGSKFFTEQVILAELLAQHIEAKTGIPVVRKTDLYVEYTGTALTAVLNQKPYLPDHAREPANFKDLVYRQVQQAYAEQFHLEVIEPLGFENTFAMVIRGDDAKRFHLQSLSDMAPVAPRWRVAVGYEFLERPDGFPGLSARYGLHFAETPKVMDLGLIYRALVDHQVDIVAGNSTDGLIDALGLTALDDNLHYFPPYDAVPIVRQSTLEQFPHLRATLAELGGKLSAAEIRRLNYAVDAQHQDVAAVVRQFRTAKGL